MAEDTKQTAKRKQSVAEAARRACAEADVRRKQQEATSDAKVARKESGGRAGPEPTRYGDWEKDGIISDF